MIYSDEEIGGEYSDTPEGLNLSESDVEVTYTRYTYPMNEPENLKPTDKSIYDAVDADLTPGKKNWHLKKK